MPRIAFGGFQHETNTFSPVKATFADFEAPDAWPGLTRGAALFDAVAGINLPAAGFVQEARGLRHELCPLLWCSAQPSGHVTRDAFERVSAMLLELSYGPPRTSMRFTSTCTARWSPSTSTTPTASCCVASARVVGPDLPIVASLDFHANVSPQMAAHASALVSFRTYPARRHGRERRASGALPARSDRPAPAVRTRSSSSIS